MTRRDLLLRLGAGTIGLVLAACGLDRPDFGPRGSSGTAAGGDPALGLAGRTVTLIIGEHPGGGYDTLGRLVTRYLPDYLPGRPKVVAENLPAGGNRAAANRLAEVRPDGTTIALLNRVVPDFQLRGEGPAQGVRYDAARLSWLGSLGTETYTLVVHHRAGIQSVDQLATKPLRLGHEVVGSVPHTFDAVLRHVLGWARGPRFFGWSGSSEVLLAIERGDIDAMIGSWSGMARRKAEDLRSGRLIPLLQMGHRAVDDPLLTGVPLARNLFDGLNDTALGLLALASRPLLYARPFAAPPGLAPELSGALRAGLMAVAADPEFEREAVALNLELEPVPGEEVHRLVLEHLATPKSLVDQLQALLEADSPS